MGRYFICLLAFLTIACCLGLQPAEATDDKEADFGFGYIFTTLSNRGLMSVDGFSWKTPLSKNFSVQYVFWFLENEKTSVGLTSRFLYPFEIHPRIQIYSGWGVSYLTRWSYETLVGFEYFFSNTTDFGWVIEFGVSRLKREVEGSEDGNRLGKRLLFGYHFYF